MSSFLAGNALSIECIWQEEAAKQPCCFRELGRMHRAGEASLGHVSSTLASLFFQRFIYSKVGITERELFHPLVHSPNGHRSFFQISPAAQTALL